MALLNDGLIHLQSPRSVRDTVDLLEAIVLARGLRVTVRIDHAADAAKAGLKMPPAELLIFGNPTAGAPLMIASPTVAIDLPLKALAWEDVDGQTWLTYNSSRYLVDRHRVPDPLLKNIAAIESICEEAVRE